MIIKKEYKRFKKISNQKNFNKIFNFFEFLLICDSTCFFSDIQFEMSRKLISKYLKLYGKNSFYFFIKPFFFLTAKPLENRMGGGKGSRSFKIFPLKKGQVFLGFNHIPFLELIKLVNILSSKLSFKIRLIKSKY